MISGQVKELDRGEQLRLLRAVRIPKTRVGGTNVSAIAFKAVLKAVDDHGAICWASAPTIAIEAGMSDRTARRAIDGLAEMGLISIEERSGKSSIYKIEWRNFGDMATPEMLTATPEIVTDEALRSVKRSDKGSDQVNVSVYPDEFELFWNAYPLKRRTGKKEAFEAWKKALKGTKATPCPQSDGWPAYLVQRATEYASSSQGRGEYVKGPTPWLNKGCWDDPPEAWGDPKSKWTGRHDAESKRKEGEL